MKYLSSIAKWLPIVIFAGIGVLSVPVCAGTDTVHLTAPHQQTGSAQFVITTASARNDLISGDSALVRIGVSSLIPVTQVGVYLNSVKITSAFKETPAGSHLLQGLVTSLRRGDNTLLVRDEGNPSNATQLVLTDHSITGPILSGPHIRLHELEAALDSASSPRARQPAPTAHAAACARGRAAPRVAPHPFHAAGGALSPLPLAQASRKASAARRRQKKQGRCPASSAIASSRKNSSVQIRPPSPCAAGPVFAEADEPGFGRPALLQ